MLDGIEVTFEWSNITDNWMAVDPGSRRRRLTTKTPTAKRIGTPTPEHDGAMAAPTPRQMGTQTPQHDVAIEADGTNDATTRCSAA